MKQALFILALLLTGCAHHPEPCFGGGHVHVMPDGQLVGPCEETK